MRVMILSRTRMGSQRCIGGIEVGADGSGVRSVRLLNPANASAAGCVDGDAKGSWPETAPYRIGEVWTLTTRPASRTEPPHVEDILVDGGTRTHTGTPEQVRAWLRRYGPTIQPAFWWEGNLDTTFDGALQSSKRVNGTGYVSRDDIPAMSTGFWTPDLDLTWDGDKYAYESEPAARIGRITYKGEPDPMPVIPAGTLIRLSLARWHQFEDSHYPEACWLQLSGWY